MNYADWHGSDYWQRVNAELVEQGKRSPSCAHCGTRVKDSDRWTDKIAKCDGCNKPVYTERAL